ncbi:MAG: hypothetical protein ACRCWY_02705 [Cellulosilyticaceae bacterium]
MSLKKQLIKNYLKMQLISNNPGQLAIRIGSLPKLEDKYKSFETNIVQLLKILPGIGDIQTDFNTGDIRIAYNQAALQPQQVIKWVNVVVDVAIDQMNFINKYWETNLDYVMETLTQILKQKAEDILTF